MDSESFLQDWEAQLQKAGTLDALVIADEDLKKVRVGIFRNFWTRF